MISAARSILAGLAPAFALVALLSAPASAQSLDSSSGAALSGRISQLEAQIRQLNGQVEQLSHHVRTLEDQLRRMSEDTEYRFQELGQGSGDGAYYAGSGASDADGRPATRLPDPGAGQPPQVLGQVPAGSLDLSGALDGGGQGGWSSDGGFGGQNSGFGGNTQLASAPTGDPREDYDIAYGHILRGDFDVAEASFRQFLDSYPSDELSGNAQYWLGESLYARGRYRDAADAFLAGYTEYPQSPKAPDSLFKLGLTLKELGQRDAACATLGEIGRTYPDASQAVRERARAELEKSGC